ncbi:TetR/AcrR family transcriptional regulator [Erwinia sp. MYb375]|uniref:TetR/AcrR family transcriptional regulator n=1 Tax=unclassified Erwinia TaxID=2622719 RepID=UPI0030B10D08
MMNDNAKGLEARKQPRQARSQATVEVILEATIQVLLAEGLPRLTTIRVAERAGVSVGTLYQYFPQKQALLFALLQRHLERLVSIMEGAALSVQGQPLAVMVKHIVSVFMQVKTENLHESAALYAVASELDTRSYVRSVEARNRLALETMLDSASDRRFADTPGVTFVFMGALIGPIRLLLEGDPEQQDMERLAGQLELLCLSYLEHVAVPR